MALSGPEKLHRVLLLLLTALLVARPLVHGEDPGLLNPQTDAAGLVLSLLWLLTAVAWAGWRLWSGQASLRAGLVEGALLAFAGLLFLGAGLAASYQHPAWLIAWEGLVLVVAFGLMRRLGGISSDRGGLLAALLATGVSLALYALYQGTLEPLRPGAPPNQGALAATFLDPDNFAAFLVLLIPVTAGLGLACWRHQAPVWRTVLTLAAATALLVALVMTRNLAALATLLLVGAAAGLWCGRGFLRIQPIRILLGLALLLAIGAGVLTLTWSALRPLRAGTSAALQGRLDDWTAAWRMGLAHPWLGVGPGCFSRNYPLYRVPTAPAPPARQHLAGAAPDWPTTAHNFALDTWATGGVFALAALVVALLAVGRHAGRFALAGAPEEDGRRRDEGGGRTYWEFYVGGTAGLLLAFLLRAYSLPSGDDILREGAETAARSMVWFAAFNLFVGRRWSGPALVLALLAGVVACLLTLAVSGDLFAPASQPLWLVAALALSAVPARSPDTGAVAEPRPGQPLPAWRRSLLLLQLPVLAGVALVYFLLVFAPATACDYHLRQANRAHGLLRALAGKAGKPGEAAAYANYITAHLNAARAADPANVVPLVALARWDLETSTAAGLPAGEKALHTLAEASALDPLNEDVKLSQVRVHLRLAERFPQQRPEHLHAAEETADAVRALDPTREAYLHYLLAESYFKLTGDRVWTSRLWPGALALAETCLDLKYDLAGRSHAEAAWRAHQEAPGPAYRLSPPQLEQVQRWLQSPRPG